MASQLSSIALAGTTTCSGSHYFDHVRVGSGTPGHATGDNVIYTKSGIECDGPIYLDSQIRSTGSCYHYCEAANATSMRLITSAGATVYTGYCYDTTTYRMKFGVGGIQMGVAGWSNASGATGTCRQPEVFRVALVANSNNAGVIHWVNPFATSCFVGPLTVHVLTGSTNSARIDVGVAAASASSDNLIDGVVTSAARRINNVNSAGTNGKYNQKIGVGEYVNGTITVGSSCTGLTGYAYITIQKCATT